MYPRPYAEYVLLERLGTGGMSQVDLARKVMEESSFIRFVVIKRIKAERINDESSIRMFKDEARITAELHHNNIAQTYDFGREADEWFLVMEYVPGIDLRHIISTLRDRKQRVPLAVTLYLLIEVLKGLDYAHGKRDLRGRPMNIVHRDVNPRNVMVSTQGEVKLIDFGVAKAEARLEETQTDHVKGKFAYMSPEQIAGDDVDARADLYAVGLVLHEFLAGYSPYYGLNQIQIMHRMMNPRAPKMPPVPEAPDEQRLREIHDKALDPELRRRYPTARAFQEALERYAEEELGGTISASKVVAFLAHVDPDLERRLRDKLEAYSGPLDEAEGQPTEEISREPGDESVSGTFASEKPVAGTSFSMSRPDTHTVTRTGIVAGGVMLAMAGWGAALGLAVVLLAAGAYLYLGPAPPGAVGPTTQEVEAGSVEAALPDTPEVEPILAQDPEPEPLAPPPGVESTPEPTAVAAPASPQPTQTVPAPAPVPASVPVARPEPPGPEVPAVLPPAAPEPVDEPAPEVIPAPVEPAALAPEVRKEPLVFGILQVTAPEKGLQISLDGQSTSFTTPARIEWPVGSVRVSVPGYGDNEVVVRRKQVTNVLFR